MAIPRNLLVLGNTKLGENIHHWSIPAVQTCPGRSAVCETVCYASSGRFVMAPVQVRLRENLEVSRRGDFVARMVKEIKRRWVQVCRVHVSGDFYSEDYSAKWLQVFLQCPKPIFYAYTRSWRVAAIEPVLRDMAQLPNVRLWFSADRETGLPSILPTGVRVAWLFDEEGAVETADLLFVVRRLRSLASRLALPLVCPAEKPQSKEKDVDCGSCGKCWR